jgi:hypothetical protein
VNNIRNGITRPTNLPNAWVADLKDKDPVLTINWDHPQSIQRIELSSIPTSIIPWNPS